MNRSAASTFSRPRPLGLGVLSGTVITWVLIGLVPAILLVAHSEEAVEKMAVVVIAVIVIAGTYGIVNAIRNTTSKGSLVYEAAERA